MKRVFVLSSIFVAIFLLHGWLLWQLDQTPIVSEDLKQRSHALYVHTSKKSESQAFFMPSKKRALFTSSHRVSVRREVPDGAAGDEGIAPAIAEEPDASDGRLAANRTLREEVNKAKKSLVPQQTTLTQFTLKDTSIGPWWHTVPTDQPFMPRALQPQDETAKIFWRGPAAAFVREVKPIVMKLSNADSAYTLCYHVEVDLKTGRMLYLQPIREDLNAHDANTVRTLLWQQPFKTSPTGGIVSGEVELCFGGEYD